MAVTLKDGTEVEDPRLDRLIEFDEQSRDYPIRTLVEQRRSRSYTWRCTQWLDQGQEGACVGFACAHELIARPMEVTGLSDQWAREKVYYEAQKIDPWPGGAYPGASPRYDGTSVLAGVKILQRLGHIKEYRWAFGLNDLVLAIGYAGPAVIGVNWYEGMYKPDDKGYIHATGSLFGGHAVCVRGVSISKQFFRIRNSWGRGWGQDGDCLIAFTDMERLLGERGEVCVPMGRTRVRQLQAVA